MITYNPNVLDNLSGHKTNAIQNGSYTEQQIMNLFQDNLTGNIDPADLRLFVGAIWEAKENSIIKIVDPKHYDYHKIKKDQLVIISEPGNLQNKNGVYVSKKDSPGHNDFNPVQKDKHIQDFLGQGKDGQVITTENGVIKWVTPFVSRVHGSLPLDAIYKLPNPQNGDIWITTTGDKFGTWHKGDGYQYTNGIWKNIGTMVGPKGEKGDASNVEGPTGPTGPDGKEGPRGKQGPQGRKGDKGSQGIDGRTGPDGKEGPKGPIGATGFQGPKGDSFKMKGFKNQKSDLDTLSSPSTKGDIWYIWGKNAQGGIIDPIYNGHGFYFDGKNWQDLGDLRGPQGIQGIPGQTGSTGGTGLPGAVGHIGMDGADGHSAYQVWKDLGHKGTEQDFIDSLKGKDGNAANFVGKFTGAASGTVGGIKKGDSFQDRPLDEMWGLLLNPYVEPKVGSVSVHNSKGIIPQNVPVGSKLEKNLTVYFTLKHTENMEDDIVITNGTNIWHANKGDSSLVVAQPIELTHEAGGSETWTVTATKKGTTKTISADYTVTWASFAYWGQTTKAALTNADTADIIACKGGDHKMFVNLPITGKTEAMPDGATGTYRYLVYPASGGSATEIQQDNFDVALQPGYEIADKKTIQMVVDGQKLTYHIYISLKALYGELRMEAK